jgi:hypothetical protein
MIHGTMLFKRKLKSKLFPFYYMLLLLESILFGPELLSSSFFFFFFEFCVFYLVFGAPYTITLRGRGEAHSSSTSTPTCGRRWT